jgi:hypothetical protein
MLDSWRSPDRDTRWLRFGEWVWASLAFALLLAGCTVRGGGGGVTTTAAYPPSLARYEALAKRELQQGSIVYNPPTQMRLDETTRIEARVTRHPDKTFTSNLQGKGQPRVEQLPVGTKMKGELLSEDFEITPLRPEVQLLHAKGFRSWVWDITPSRTGNLTLTLVVSVVYEGDPLDSTSLDRNIRVTVTRSHATGSWIGHNWDKVLGALGITGAGIFAFFRRRILVFFGRRPTSKQGDNP